MIIHTINLTGHRMKDHEIRNNAIDECAKFVEDSAQSYVDRTLGGASAGWEMLRIAKRMVSLKQKAPPTEEEFEKTELDFYNENLGDKLNLFGRLLKKLGKLVGDKDPGLEDMEKKQCREIDELTRRVLEKVRRDREAVRDKALAPDPREGCRITMLKDGSYCVQHPDGRMRRVNKGYIESILSNLFLNPGEGR